MLCVCCGFGKQRRGSAVEVVCPVSWRVLMWHCWDFGVLFSRVIPLTAAHEIVLEHMTSRFFGGSLAYTQRSSRFRHVDMIFLTSPLKAPRLSVQI